MATMQSVLLSIDKSREDYEEIKAYEAYLDKLEKDRKERQKGGLFGSVIGAIGGFLIGGPAGLIAGYSAGSQGGKWLESHDDYGKSKDRLAKEVFKGGKFNWKETRDWAKNAKEQAKDLRNAQILETAVSAITTGVGVSQAGGFMEGAEQEAWRNLSFGERISTLGVGGGTKTDEFGNKITQPGFRESLKESFGAGDTNVLDLVEGTADSYFANVPGVKGQFARNVFKGAGGIPKMGTDAYNIAKWLSLNQAIQSGEGTMAELFGWGND